MSTFIPKTESHWSKEYIDTMKHFALIVVDDKEYVRLILGEHWNKNGPVTKRELKETYKTDKDALEKNGCRMVWVKTDYGQMFYEVDEEDIPDDATTEMEKYFIIDVDEDGDKQINKDPFCDEIDLWNRFYTIARRVSDLETHWRIYDKTRIPEIYEAKEGFIAQKVSKRWRNVYSIKGEPVEYNAAIDRKMLDELQAERKENGEEWEFITMGDGFDFFLKKFE